MAQEPEHAAPGLGLGLVLALRDGNCEDVKSGPLVVSLADSSKNSIGRRRHRVDEHVQLTVRLENTSGTPLFLRLGAIAGGADDATVLAAFGLQSEVNGQWMPARMLEPRSVPGGVPVVLRERALYLPPRQGACFPITGVALGSSISFGGLSSDDAEVLLPLQRGSETVTGSMSCHLRFALQGEGGPAPDTSVNSPRRERASWLNAGCAWLGPFMPPSINGDECCWQGSVEVQPISLRLQPRIATAFTDQSVSSVLEAKSQVKPRKAVPMPRAPAWPKPGRTFRRKQQDLAASGALVPLPAKKKNQQKRWPRLPSGCKHEGKTLRDEGVSLKEKQDDALVDVQESQDSDYALCTLPTMELSQKSEGHRPRPPKDSRLALMPHRGGAPSGRQLDSIEHSARWRGLNRDMDPLSDPMLLELAEVIKSMCPLSSTLVFYSRRLKTRTGQRFADSLRALGHRVKEAPEFRMFSKWALAPRAFVTQESMLLVTDWDELHSCLKVIEQAAHSGVVNYDLLGTVALSERRDESEATALVSGACLSCPWRVVPLLAFAK